MILPVFLLTVMSAMIAGKAFAKPPIATPRPLTTLPLSSFDADTFGFQSAAFETASSTPIQRALLFTSVASMFLMRNAIGSSPASWASASIICSEANSDCGAAGARSQMPLRKPL